MNARLDSSMASPPVQQSCCCNTDTAPELIATSGRFRSLQTDEVQLCFLVAALARPQIERRAGDVVYEGHGIAELGEVDGLHVVPAVFAGVEPHMGKLCRV